MVVFRVLSMDEEMVNRLLHQPITGQVHSVFSGAINFNDGQGHLFALVSAQSDNAPYSLRVETPARWSWRSLPIRTGDTVRIEQGLMCIGGSLMITLTGAAVWSPTLPVLPKDKGTIKTNSLVLRRAVWDFGKTGGMLPAHSDRCGELCSGAQPVFSEIMETRVRSLKNTLLSGEYDRAVEAGLMLVGLGVGLTPAGDDFLSGLMVVFHLEGGLFCQELREFGLRLTERAVGRTTDLSFSILRGASKGKAREAVINLLYALGQTEPLRITAAAKKVLQIGSTSGTDLALGMYEGLELGLKQAGEWGSESCRSPF